MLFASPALKGLVLKLEEFYHNHGSFRATGTSHGYLMNMGNLIYEQHGGKAGLRYAYNTIRRSLGNEAASELESIWRDIR